MEKVEEIREIKKDLEEFAKSQVKEIPLYKEFANLLDKEGIIGKRLATVEKDGGYILDEHEFYTTCNNEVVYSIKKSHQSMNPFVGERGRLLKRSSLEEDLLKAIDCFYEVSVYGDKKTSFSIKEIRCGKDEKNACKTSFSINGKVNDVYYTRDCYTVIKEDKNIKLEMEERDKLRQYLKEAIEDFINKKDFKDL